MHVCGGVCVTYLTGHVGRRAEEKAGLIALIKEDQEGARWR